MATSQACLPRGPVAALALPSRRTTPTRRRTASASPARSSPSRLLPSELGEGWRAGGRQHGTPAGSTDHMSVTPPQPLTLHPLQLHGAALQQVRRRAPPAPSCRCFAHSHALHARPPACLPTCRSYTALINAVATVGPVAISADASPWQVGGAGGCGWSPVEEASAVPPPPLPLPDVREWHLHPPW